MIRQNTGKAGLHFLPVSQPSLCQQGMRQSARVFAYRVHSFSPTSWSFVFFPPNPLILSLFFILPLS